MQSRFGFIASDKLVQLLTEANDRLEAGKNSKDPMYPYRNRLIECVADELIENIMINQAHKISDKDRKEALLKLGNTVKGVVGKVVQVMLAKDKDSVVLQSKPFLEESVAKDQDGNIRMGLTVPTDFYTEITQTFHAINNGELNADIIKTVQKNLKKFDDLLLGHFIVNFVKTLGWGMIKMNLAKGAKATITTADNIMIDQMIPKLKIEELQEIAPHLQSFFFETDISGEDVFR